MGIFHWRRSQDLTPYLFRYRYCAKRCLRSHFGCRYGHTAVYPTPKQTVGLTIPLANITVPEHTVLHAGACKLDDQRTGG